ncbi:MAG TPA: hypothetical protein VL361_13725 [Candidatus Limnocylindrales bacterium]|nr:hypothetical protein [Candidatus Limnocylindrales bacterium]
MKSSCFAWRLLLINAGAGLLLAGMIVGCGRDDVQVYRVSKEQSSPAAPGQSSAAPPAAMPPGHPEISSGGPPSLTYKLPSGWQEAPGGQMRAAAFRIQGKEGKQADVGVIPLPGFMGHDLENVNRWRESVGLKAVSETDLAKLAEPVQVGGEAGQLYDQAGENPGSGEKTRILVAVARHEGIAWFFKMNGDDELVAQQKQAFVDFLKSVNFSAGSTQPPGLPPSHPPIGNAGTVAAQAAPQNSGPGKPGWQVPAGWQEVAGGQFLVAKFLVSGADNAKATVNVSSAAGDGGGLTGNINRWRGQLRLSPLSEAEIGKLVTPVDSAGGKAMFVDMTGTDPSGQKARLIGAIIPEGSQTWFYKLMGNEQLVDREKDAFAKFVQTAKY